MENKKAFLKEDLIIFARYLSRRVEPIIAYKFIKPNKQYVFVGIFNKDKTKVKNVLTGEVLKINGIYAWNRLERYLIFPAPDFPIGLMSVLQMKMIIAIFIVGFVAMTTYFHHK